MKFSALTLLLSVTTIAGAVPLFDGKTFAGWEGDTAKTWRIENDALVGGSMEGNRRNEFLMTQKSYRNFSLKFDYKLTGTEGFVNGGVQFHSERVPKSENEVRGFQADIGASYTGFLQDESRRSKCPAAADRELVKSLEKPGDWNRYEIRAEGPHVQLFVNGVRTVDYTEKDPAIPLEGRIGLQIHGGCKAVIFFRNLTIEEITTITCRVHPFSQSHEFRQDRRHQRGNLVERVITKWMEPTNRLMQSSV